jgi:hypothetical protein
LFPSFKVSPDRFSHHEPWHLFQGVAKYDCSLDSLFATLPKFPEITIPSI